MLSKRPTVTAARLTLAGALCVALCQLTLTGCSKPAHAATTDPSPTPAPHIDMTMQDPDTAKRQNEFAFNLLHVVDAKAGNDNTFISPLSIDQAMGMLYLGASGDTKNQIGEAMHLDGLSDWSVGGGAQHLRQYITGADPTVQMDIANALWADKRMSFKNSYQDECLQYFDAPVTTLDFASPSAADTINTWTSDHTRGKIKSIVEPQDLNALGAVITDAVYFHGKWSSPFDASATKPEDFTQADGTVKQVQMMQKTAHLLYRETEHYQGVGIPYGDGSITMWIALPKPGHDLHKFAAAANADNASDLVTNASSKLVELYLPKFHVDTSVSLKDTLQSLGIWSAFNPGKADFSPMSATPLCVGNVLHKATLDVDENGTVATAATGIIMQSSAIAIAPTPIVVDVNHPFLCLITENKTGAILFLGAIRSPEKLTQATQ